MLFCYWWGFFFFFFSFVICVSLSLVPVEGVVSWSYSQADSINWFLPKKGNSDKPTSPSRAVVSWCSALRLTSPSPLCGKIVQPNPSWILLKMIIALRTYFPFKRQCLVLVMWSAATVFVTDLCNISALCCSSGLLRGIWTTHVVFPIRWWYETK